MTRITSHGKLCDVITCPCLTYLNSCSRLSLLAWNKRWWKLPTLLLITIASLIQWTFLTKFYITKGVVIDKMSPSQFWIILTKALFALYLLYHWHIFSCTWWRHQMETFSALLAICAGNSPVTSEFPAKRPVTRSFDVCCDLHLNKRLSKQSRGWWFKTPWRPLWHHCNEQFADFPQWSTYFINKAFVTIIKR